MFSFEKLLSGDNWELLSIVPNSTDLGSDTSFKEIVFEEPKTIKKSSTFKEIQSRRAVKITQSFDFKPVNLNNEVNLTK